MPSRAHDRSHFFKYASYETALKVLRSKSFLWSSPIKFNDPFDSQIGFVLDSNQNEFAKAYAASIERVIFSDIGPSVRPESPLGKEILHLRSIRGRLHGEKLRLMLHEWGINAAANLDGSMDQRNVAIQEVLCDSRVLCVSELHDNVVMWSHYAEEHRGVVFKLRCIDEIDNKLLAARKVSYSDAFPPFPSDDEYTKHLTGEQPIDFAPLSWELAFTKHTDWSYEKEWRVQKHVQDLQEPRGDGFTIYPENPRVFEAVYLGCRMEDQKVTEIVETVRQNLPATKILRGKKSTTAFKLSFAEIN